MTLLENFERAYQTYRDDELLAIPANDDLFSLGDVDPTVELRTQPPALSPVVGEAVDVLEDQYQETKFQDWYGGHAERLGLNPNPDDPQHFYDYRSAFKAGAEPDETGHWPSAFKAENHLNRYVDGIDTKTGAPPITLQHLENQYLEKLEGEKTPEQRNRDAARRLPGVLGRSLKRGLTGAAATAGSALQYLGQKELPELGGPSLIDIAMRFAPGGSTRAEASLIAAEIGDTAAAFWERHREAAEEPEFKGKNVVDNPEMLINPKWWLSTSGEFAVSAAISMTPAVGTFKYLAALKSPSNLAKLAKIGAAIVGGSTAGGLEAGPTYRQVVEEGGSPQQAADAAEGMFVLSAALNSISAGKMLGRGGVLGKAAIEGVTEAAEEPAQFFAEMRAILKNGGELPDDAVDQFIDSLKSAATVAGPAALTGGGVSAATDVAARSARKDFERGPGARFERLSGTSVNFAELDRAFAAGEIDGTSAALAKGFLASDPTIDPSTAIRVVDEVRAATPEILESEGLDPEAPGFRVTGTSRTSADAEGIISTAIDLYRGANPTTAIEELYHRDYARMDAVGRDKVQTEYDESGEVQKERPRTVDEYYAQERTKEYFLGKPKTGIAGALKKVRGVVETALRGTGKKVGPIQRGIDERKRGESAQIQAPDTPEFKAWFGDSKVVDESGEPLVVYHGTDADFDRFSIPSSGVNSNVFGSWPVERSAAFFAEDEAFAEEFAGQAGRKGRTVPVRLSIQNPVDLEADGFLVLTDKFWDKHGLNGRYYHGLDRHETWEAFDLENGGQELVDALRAEGYDGAKLQDVSEGDPESTTSWAVFDPTQIKSATGNVGTFDPEDPRISHQVQPSDTGQPPTATIADVPAESRQVSAPVWYSSLEREIGKEKFPGKGTGESMAQAVDSWAKKGRVKAEEVEWSGVKDWLREQPGKVSKQEVLDYLAENNVRVEEVELGEASPADRARLDELDDALSESERGEYNRLTDAELLPETTGRATKFEQYQLPGGENYKELLLTLPKARGVTEAYRGLEKYRSRMEKKYEGVADLFQSGVWEKTATAEEVETLQSFVDGANRADEARPIYKGSHYEEPNVLAHIRFNERTGPNGEKVLFIEEVQSDWAQTGRKRGFAGQLGVLKSGHRMDEYDLDDKTLFMVVDDGGVGITGGYETREKALREYQSIDRPSADFVTPDMPFSKTWPSLAMKRMVRYAAENGFDSIAWTPGEVQAERYDLSKQIQHLSYDEKNNQLIAIGLGERGTVIDEIVPKEKLEDFVGKEVAKRLLEAPEAQFGDIPGFRRWLFNEDLKVGDEGMAGFYDRILPSAVNKFFNKAAWGKAKVGTIAIGTQDYSAPEDFPWAVRDIEGGEATDYFATEKEAVDFADREYGPDNPTVDVQYQGKGGTEVHGLPITPEMRQKALSEGLPSFQVQPPKGPIAKGIQARKETGAAEQPLAAASPGIIRGFRRSDYDTEYGIRPGKSVAFFSVDKSMAASFGKAGATVYEVDVEIRSPYYADWEEIEYLNSNPEEIEAIKASGHDGIIERSEDQESWQVAVFDKGQILPVAPVEDESFQVKKGPIELGTEKRGAARVGQKLGKAGIKTTAQSRKAFAAGRKEGTAKEKEKAEGRAVREKAKAHVKNVRAKMAEREKTELRNKLFAERVEQVMRDAKVDKQEAIKRVRKQRAEAQEKQRIKKAAAKREASLKKKERKEISKMMDKLRKVKKQVDRGTMSALQAKPILDLLEGFDLVSLNAKAEVSLTATREYFERNGVTMDEFGDIDSGLVKKISRLDLVDLRKYPLEGGFDKKGNQFLGLRDIFNAVMFHVKMEATKKKIRVGRTLRSAEEVKNEAIASMKPAKAVQSDILPPPRPKAPSRVAKGVKDIFGIKQVAYDTLIEGLFGQNSVAHKILYRDVNRGTQLELQYKQSTFDNFTKDLIEAGVIKEGDDPRDLADWLKEDVKVGPYTMTRDQRMALYRHSLVPDNRKAILKSGFGARWSGAPDKAFDALDKEGLDKAMAQLTQKEKAFAGKPVDNLFDRQFEMLNKVFEAKNGYPLTKVERYFPKYTMPFSRGGDEEAERAIDRLKRETTTRVGIEKGILIKRIGSTLPIYLDGLTGTINKSIVTSATYIGLELPLSNASKLLYNREFRAEMRDRYGMDVWREIETGLRDIAGERQNYEALDQLFMKIKNNVAPAALGLNPWVMMKQAASLPLYMTYVKGEYLKEGIMTTAVAPRAMKQKHMDNSVTFRERVEGGFNRDVADLFRVSSEGRLTANSTKKTVTNAVKRALKMESLDPLLDLQLYRERTLAGIKLLDEVAVVPGMEGAFLQAKAELNAGRLSKHVQDALDMTERDPRIAEMSAGDKQKAAYEFADYVTVRTQPMFSPAHRSPMSRGSALEKSFSMFGGFTNRALNLARRTIEDGNRKGWDKQSQKQLVTVGILLGVVNPLQVMTIDWMRDVYYGRETGGLISRWIRALSGYVFYLRDIVEFVQAKQRGGIFGRGIELPQVQVINTMFNAAYDMVDVVFGKWGDRTKKENHAALLRAIDTAIYSSMLGVGLPYRTPKNLIVKPFTRSKKKKPRLAR